MTVFKNLVHPEFGELRTVEIDGEPWFVGKDVAAALRYTNSRDAIATHVFADDKGVESIDTLGGRQKMTIINESGLYALVFGSRLKIAKEFKHWVTSEVLPSIRKNGAYIRNQENMTPAEIVAHGLIAAQKIIEDKERKVISLGAGLPVQEQNEQYIKQLGTVVYLKGSAETLRKRLEGNSNPLLEGENQDEKIKKLLKQRDPVYHKFADIEVVTGVKPFEELIKEIEEQLP